MFHRKLFKCSDEVGGANRGGLIDKDKAVALSETSLLILQPEAQACMEWRQSAGMERNRLTLFRSLLARSDLFCERFDCVGWSFGHLVVSSGGGVSERDRRRCKRSAKVSVSGRECQEVHKTRKNGRRISVDPDPDRFPDCVKICVMRSVHKDIRKILHVPSGTVYAFREPGIRMRKLRSTSLDPNLIQRRIYPSLYSAQSSLYTSLQYQFQTTTCQPHPP